MFLFLSQFFVLCSILAHISFCPFLSGHITLNAFCSVVPLLNRFRVSIYDKFANRFNTNASVRSGRSVTFEEVFFVSAPPLSRDYLNVKDKTPVLFEPFSREPFSHPFHCCALSHGFFLTNEVLILIFYLETKCVRVCVVGLRWVADCERNKRVWCVYVSHRYRSQKRTHSVDDVIFAKYWLLFIPSLSSPLWFKYNRTMRNVVLIR